MLKKIIDYENEILGVYEYISEELKFFIVLDNLRNGPAVGACRYINNFDRTEALKEVQRMARTMTDKNIIANIPFGGGKSFIYYNTLDKNTMLKIFADALNELNGKYYVTNDIGISIEDLQILKGYSTFVKGSMIADSYVPATSYSVFLALKAAVKFYYHTDDLSNYRVAIQGIGNVGYPLAKFLYESGCKLYINEINTTQIKKLSNEIDFEIINDDFSTSEVDILVPCACGDVITKSNVGKLNAKVIVGGANNQLEEEKLADVLFEKNICFVPDMLANCGGMIDLFCEGENYCQKYVFDKIEFVYQKVYDLLQLSLKENKSPNEILFSEVEKIKNNIV